MRRNLSHNCFHEAQKQEETMHMWEGRGQILMKPPTGNPKLVQVPLFMLKTIEDYMNLEPKEISKLPLRVRMALSDLTEYIPRETNGS